MQIVILAAGSGKRMKSLTESKHKSLLEIGNGETFLSKICHQINEYDISKAVIVTGYRPESIVDTLNQFQFNFEVVHNERYEEDVNIYSLKLALDRLSNKENTIIIEADVIMDDVSFKSIYFSSSQNKSIWFTRGYFQEDQYGGILQTCAKGTIKDIRIVSRYAREFRKYHKILGVTTIGQGEFGSFYELLNQYCKKSIKQYYLNPWIDHLDRLPCLGVDLGKDAVTSINTPDEYSTYRKLSSHAKKVPEYELIDVDKLIPIEGFIDERKKLIFEKVKDDQYWTKPVVLDSENYLIMDGHHRFEAAKQLKLRKIPAILVSYKDVRVWSLRTSEKVTVELVRERALLGEIYPNKTVKHKFPFEVGSCNIPLKDLS